MTLDHNITLDVLSGGAYGKTVNDNALVFLLRYGEIDFLITSDVGLEVLEDLPLENPEQIDVLEMAHHGSPYSFAPELYHSYQPQGVILSLIHI